MTLLLAADTVSLTPPNGLDSHGWRLPGDTPTWTGIGNLQLQPGVSDPRGGEGGGRGPHGPARDLYGQLYLPIDAPVVEGMVAEVRGRTFAVSQAREVHDPTGVNLNCWAMTVQSFDTWPPEDAPPALLAGEL